MSDAPPFLERMCLKDIGWTRERKFNGFQVNRIKQVFSLRRQMRTKIPIMCINVIHERSVVKDKGKII